MDSPRETISADNNRRKPTTVQEIKQAIKKRANIISIYVSRIDNYTTENFPLGFYKIVRDNAYKLASLTVELQKLQSARPINTTPDADDVEMIKKLQSTTQINTTCDENDDKLIQELKRRLQNIHFESVCNTNGISQLYFPFEYTEWEALTKGTYNREYCLTVLHAIFGENIKTTTYDGGIKYIFKWTDEKVYKISISGVGIMIRELKPVSEESLGVPFMQEFYEGYTLGTHQNTYT
jgi:hypothetical protein